MTKKRFLLALALMLTAVGGAWAQGSVTATQLNIPDEWAGYTNRLTASDLQGFVPVTAEQAQAWDNIPSGDVFLIYGFNNNGEALYALFQNGSIYTQNPLVSAPLYLNDVWMMSQNVQYYYVSGVTAAAPLLNWNAATKTGSLTTPAGNVTLSVTYYGQYRLDSIPQGWTVMVNDANWNDSLKAYTDGGNPQMRYIAAINETDSVELVPPAELRETIKAVRLTEVLPYVDLDANSTAWADGSNFAVPAGGLTYSDAVTVSGNVTLTLTEGETLTLNKGISLAEGATLTVQGNGTMYVNGTNGSTASTVAGSTGTLVLTSGTLFATGGNGGGLWEGNDQTASAGGVAINGNVTVSGGTATATGGNGGGIGGQFAVNNRCGNGGAAISGNATINAGTWTATNGSNGSNTVTMMNSENIVGTGGAAVAGTVTDNR